MKDTRVLAVLVILGAIAVFIVAGPLIFAGGVVVGLALIAYRRRSWRANGG